MGILLALLFVCLGCGCRHPPEPEPQPDPDPDPDPEQHHDHKFLSEHLAAAVSGVQSLQLGGVPWAAAGFSAPFKASPAAGDGWERGSADQLLLILAAPR